MVGDDFMERNELRRAIVRSAVHKGIAEVCEDPKRGIRKMVDLGMHFSRGRFQKVIFDSMQTALLDENSAYYKMVMHMVQNVRPQYLEDFGIDIGYNSWTHGAQIIRAHEQEHGYNVPWCLVLDLREHLQFDLDELMTQGEKLGIYSYLIFGGSAGEVAGIFPILHKHRDCAVFLMLKSAELPVVNVENAGNVLVLLPAEDEETAASARQLRAHQCCFGLWMGYNGDNMQQILHGKLEESAEEMGACFAFAAACADADAQTREIVQQYVNRARKDKRHIAFIVELMSDLLSIDRIISVESCLLGIHADGSVFTEQEEKRNLSVRSIALEDILMCTMPRVTYPTEE